MTFDIQPTVKPRRGFVVKPWSNAERSIACAMRAHGASNVKIAVELKRSQRSINAEIGAVLGVPKAVTQAMHGVNMTREGTRKLTRDALRNVDSGYALPAGSPATWGAISSEVFARV